jgi:hypothetical protein
MALLPDIDKLTTPKLIFAAYEKNAEEPHRMHLGASLIGRECRRALWYTFRWAHHKNHTGQLLRLFGSGHLQEARVIADLRAAGVELTDQDAGGKQWRIGSFTEMHGGHFDGSMDAVGLGFPEAPKTWHVVDVKGMNEKNFAKIVKDGLEKAKPEYFGQAQVYMRATKLERAIYIIVNKNTDEIHVERIRLDIKKADALVTKAGEIIRAPEPPPRVSEKPDWFQCRMCDHAPICHDERAPEANCRTCAHSTPVTDRPGKVWLCGAVHMQSMPELSERLQRTGCSEHRYIPVLLEKTCKPIDFADGVVIYQCADGSVFGNGDGTRGTFASQEIRNSPSPAMLPALAEVKADFPKARLLAAEGSK